MELVKCTREYWEFVRSLREEEKAGFISQEPISKHEHSLFMSKHSDNYKICLIDGEPVGFVGVVGDDIRVAVRKEYQRRGIGKFMIQSCEGKAVVKIGNEASINLFLSCGYKPQYIILEKE